MNDNLESVNNPGIFFAGELVDIDGKCGGYNLQWAWSNGVVALSQCLIIVTDRNENNGKEMY